MAERLTIVELSMPCRSTDLPLASALTNVDIQKAHRRNDGTAAYALVRQKATMRTEPTRRAPDGVRDWP